jgi:hypothetical protein
MRVRARARFASFVPEAQRVTAEVREHVEFVPAMGNFETVSCPGCGILLDNDWWVQAMDAAYSERGFADLTVTLPCCGAASSLNDLHYYFPQGFARFVLSAFEPNIVDLQDWQVRELEELLGCKLRKVWVHM